MLTSPPIGDFVRPFRKKGSAAIAFLRGANMNRAPVRRPLDPVLGRIGALEVRLATTPREIRAAQRLRYKVFYEEGRALPHTASALARRDFDEYDAICDHLLVLDHSAPSNLGEPARKLRGVPARTKHPAVVGTYRLLRQEVAERHFGFYTQAEYDIAPILAAHPTKRFLELGRSCVLKPYRNKRTVELLWHGIWSYVLHHKVDVMLGCASLEGTDPQALALPLSFLHHHAAADSDWRARAVADRYVPMDRLPESAVDSKAALHALPPLIKGYLRLGARFGDGAVVDRQFGTTDVLVVLPVSAISPRYVAHFGADAGRHAA
ncbi:GNAT family N-acetyltransferase [Salinarimonas ramus]|nr:GNAT family N-acyltransferase [Salinarimonas ramus]